WMVLSGRCIEDEETPYGPMREVIAAAVASSSARTLVDAVGANGALLARLVPALRQKARGMSAAADLAPEKVREQLFPAVFDFLTSCQGAKPLLIVLDDLQWADEATVLLLRDMAERIGGSKVVILGTFWESELDAARPFSTAVSRLLRRRRAQRVAMSRLTDREVEKMLAGLAADAPLTPVQVIGIQAATEGNPLFVEQSYLYMAESETMLGGGARMQTSFTEEDLELAQSVRGLIGRRLERLSEPAQRMLVAAAVIGRDFNIALLEAFGELAGHELRDALDEATRGHFLTT